MSILLTAAKKKDSKAKSKSLSSSSLGSNAPPVSTHITSVWYWKLNGVLTTLMYNRDTDEVWCNGYTLESQSRVDASYGYITDFSIFLDDRGSSHQGQLFRDELGEPVLYVDGQPIQKRDR